MQHRTQCIHFLPLHPPEVDEAAQQIYRTGYGTAMKLLMWSQTLLCITLLVCGRQWHCEWGMRKKRCKHNMQEQPGQSPPGSANFVYLTSLFGELAAIFTPNFVKWEWQQPSPCFFLRNVNKSLKWHYWFMKLWFTWVHISKQFSCLNYIRMSSHNFASQLIRHPMYGTQSTCLFSGRALLSVSSRWGSLQLTQQGSMCRSRQLLGNVVSIIPHPPSLPTIKSWLQRPWYKYRFFPLNSKHLTELSKVLSLS